MTVAACILRPIYVDLEYIFGLFSLVSSPRALSSLRAAGRCRMCRTQTQTLPLASGVSDSRSGAPLVPRLCWSLHTRLSCTTWGVAAALGNTLTKRFITCTLHYKLHATLHGPSMQRTARCTSTLLHAGHAVTADARSSGTVPPTTDSRRCCSSCARSRPGPPGFAWRSCLG